jgi:hypothetical protein
VLEIVTQRVVRLSQRALPGPGLKRVAIIALLAIAALRVPFPLVGLGAGLIGAVFLGPTGDTPGRVADGRSDVAGSRAGPPIDGMLGGLLGSAITLGVTFVPALSPCCLARRSWSACGNGPS